MAGSWLISGLRRAQLKPVEAVTGKGEQVRQLTDAGKLHVAGHLYRCVPIPVLQIQLDGLREPGEVVDAQHRVVAQFADVGQHGRVGPAKLAEGTDGERLVAPSDG